MVVPIIKKKRWLPAREILIFAASLVILVIIFLPLVKNFKRRDNINKQITVLEEEIKKTENKNTDLQQLINYLRSDQFVEEQARLNLNMKKPGESVAILSVGDSTANSKQTGSSSADSSEQKQANPGRWLKYFFK